MFQMYVFEPGAGAAPSTAIQVDNLGGRFDTYEHTIRATGGFETCTITLTVDLDEATEWLTNGLMRSIVVYGPDATTLWEGYLETVTMQAGQESRSRSVRDMFNRVVVHYTTPNGVALATGTSDDTTSQGRYGIKTRAESPSTPVYSTAAEALRDRLMAQYKEPITTPTTSVATGDLGQVQLTLQFVGWYETLGWIFAFNSSTSTSSTTTQVGTLLSDITTGNNFISTSTALITASGEDDIEYIAPDTPYRTKIETLLGAGNSSGQRQGWGVYEDRVFHVNTWAGAAPTVLHYRRSVGDARLYDANSGEVELWEARPDRMYEVIEFLDVSPGATSDTVARYYVERIAFAMDGSSMRLALEPASSNNVDVLIAKMNR
jgi:hypothetical protein